MKRIFSLFSLLLMAAVQTWAGAPDPEVVQYVQLYENGPMGATTNLGATSDAPVQSAYDYLASLIGKKKYTLAIFTISTNEEGDIQLSAMGQNFPCPPDAISMLGNNYLLDGQFMLGPDVLFEVEDGAITHIYAMDGDDAIGEFAESSDEPALESDLVALIGETVYHNDAMLFEIYVEDGAVMAKGLPIIQMGGLSKDGNDYVCIFFEATFVFVVEDGEIARVDMYTGEEITSFYKIEEQEGPLAGLLSVPQAGKLNVQAYFTATMGCPYQYKLVKGAYYSLDALLEDMDKSSAVYENNKEQNVESTPQSITIESDNVELEDGEDYTLIVYFQDDSDEPNEIATIPFTVGVGEKESDDIMTISAGKLNITYSFSVSNEKFQEGMKYVYELYEGKYYSMKQVQSPKIKVIYSSFGKEFINEDDLLTMSSNPEKISLVSNDVELEDGKTYTLIVYNNFKQAAPEFYIVAHFKAVDNSTPTAIDAVNAPAAKKAIKTLENGRVVIIRDNKKYDLSGREL